MNPLSAAERPIAAKAGMAFPFLDLKAQYVSIREEINEAVLRVMESQQFILGPDVSAFESEIGPTVGCDHAISCASGSDALLLALMALGAKAGDEVVTVPFTFVASAGFARLGIRPVFIDIDPYTYNMDPAQLEKAITPRTCAIMPVHLFGLCADMGPILDIAKAHGVPVIEDAAQAIGAQYRGKPAGSMGSFGCFSFFPSKNLGGAGDGGLVSTVDAGLAAKLKMLRVHGSPRRYEYDLLGVNSRLDSLQAAILRVKLRHLDSWASGRQRNAEHYRRAFQEMGLAEAVTVPTAPAGSVHVYNQFTIRVRDRDSLKRYLSEQGIPSEIYYPYPLHLQPAFAYLGHQKGDFPQTEAASREVLSLPIYPELTAQQIDSVVRCIAAFFKAKH
jgi:dTDP-4-amino-4,6-dideoxygalactose transaminase